MNTTTLVILAVIVLVVAGLVWHKRQKNQKDDAPQDEHDNP